MTIQITLPVDEPLLARVDHIAGMTGRSREQVFQDILSRFLDYDTWVEQEIEAATREADAGNFASDEEVNAVFAKHGVIYRR